MTPAAFLQVIYAPAAHLLYQIIPPQMNTPLSVQMLMTIAGQESDWSHRLQVVNSGPPPARGFWQFEKGGGVAGVMTHRASEPYARSLCSALAIPFQTQAIHDALAYNDALALGFARLLLWTDYRPLSPYPSLALEIYYATWRPGKPRPKDWYPNWAAALEVVEVS